MARSSSMLASSLLVLLALAVAPVQQAQAHGGGFHDWDWDTPGYNYTRVLLATASNFTFYDASLASSFLPGDIPFFPSYASPAKLSGPVTVWEYLDSTCRETATLQANVNLTSGNGQPITNQKVYIYGMTGKCASGVLDTYKQNLTLGNSRTNMLWAGREDNFSNENGTLMGSAPNIFFPRSNATAAGPALSSILLAFAPDVSPLLCADLKWTTVDAAAWAKKIKDCKPSAAGGDRRRRMTSRAALRSN